MAEIRKQLIDGGFAQVGFFRKLADGYFINQLQQGQDLSLIHI